MEKLKLIGLMLLVTIVAIICMELVSETQSLPDTIR